MQLHFSGVAGKAEYEMLTEAVVSHILVDPTDLKNLNGTETAVALDSGAYRAWKSAIKRSSFALYLN